MKYPMDELHEHYPAIRAGVAPKGFGIWEHLDRRTYRDELEYLETPGLSLEAQFSVVDSLSKLNHQSGYTAAVLRHLGSLISVLPHPTKAPLKILDIGVGGGGLLRAIHGWTQKHKIAAELWGMDISENFIQRAKKRLETEKIPVQFVCSDACRMEKIEADTFDIVLSNYMVHHLRSIRQVADFLREVYRVGKSWLIVDFQRKIMGPLLMKVVAAPFFPPQVLVDDGVKSIRRAYRAREINVILRELEKEGRVRGMHAKPLTFLPYWVLKGQKKFLSFLLMVALAVSITGCKEGDPLSQKDKTTLDQTLAHWETWVPARKKEGTAPLITFHELYQGLDPEAQNFLDRMRQIKPSDKDFDPTIRFQRIDGQQIFRDGKMEMVNTQYLPQNVYDAYERMMAAMKKDLGKRLWVDSGYRSPAYQLYTFLYYTPKHHYSIKETREWIALPGHSEHGDPRRQAIDFVNEEGINGDSDFGQVAEDFEALPEYRWLQQKAGEFGFELSYPRGHKDTTFEPWHWRSSD